MTAVGKAAETAWDAVQRTGLKNLKVEVKTVENGTQGFVDGALYRMAFDINFGPDAAKGALRLSSQAGPNDYLFRTALRIPTSAEERAAAALVHDAAVGSDSLKLAVPYKAVTVKPEDARITFESGDGRKWMLIESGTAPDRQGDLALRAATEKYGEAAKLDDMSMNYVLRTMEDDVAEQMDQLDIDAQDIKLGIQEMEAALAALEKGA